MVFTAAHDTWQRGMNCYRRCSLSVQRYRFYRHSEFYLPRYLPSTAHAFFVTLVHKGEGLRKPPLTFEQVGISGRVIYRWYARDNLTSMVYKTFLNLAPFFKMTAKMADSLQKTYTRISRATL